MFWVRDLLGKGTLMVYHSQWYPNGVPLPFGRHPNGVAWGLDILAFKPLGLTYLMIIIWLRASQVCLLANLKNTIWRCLFNTGRYPESRIVWSYFKQFSGIWTYLLGRTSRHAARHETTSVHTDRHTVHTHSTLDSPMKILASGPVVALPFDKWYNI